MTQTKLPCYADCVGHRARCGGLVRPHSQKHHDLTARKIPAPRLAKERSLLVLVRSLTRHCWLSRSDGKRQFVGIISFSAKSPIDCLARTSLWSGKGRNEEAQQVHAAARCLPHAGVHAVVFGLSARKIARNYDRPPSCSDHHSCKAIATGRGKHFSSLHWCAVNPMATLQGVPIMSKHSGLNKNRAENRREPHARALSHGA